MQEQNIQADTHNYTSSSQGNGASLQYSDLQMCSQYRELGFINVTIQNPATAFMH